MTSIVIHSTDTAEEVEAKLRAVGSLVAAVHLARQRAGWSRHAGAHRWRVLVNQPHPETGRPTYVGCEKCGRRPPPAGRGGER